MTKENLQYTDVFTKQTIMAECFPNILSIDKIKCSIEVDKIDIQRKVVLNYAVMNNKVRRE